MDHLQPQDPRQVDALTGGAEMGDGMGTMQSTKTRYGVRSSHQGSKVRWRCQTPLNLLLYSASQRSFPPVLRCVSAPEQRMWPAGGK